MVRRRRRVVFVATTKKAPRRAESDFSVATVVVSSKIQTTGKVYQAANDWHDLGKRRGTAGREYDVNRRQTKLPVPLANHRSPAIELFRIVVANLRVAPRNSALRCAEMHTCVCGPLTFRRFATAVPSARTAAREFSVRGMRFAFR
jgi:hypothetical protein